MDLRLGLASIEETVVVTVDAPLLEVGRGGAAGYVSEEEMEALPLSGRAFVRFALLQPTVQVVVAGQRLAERAARSQHRIHDRRRERQERVLRFRTGRTRREGAATSWPRSRSGSFRVAQQILGVYAQDSWRPNPRLTLHYGARWDATFNPAGIENMLPAGRSIPDDRDNFSPRGGFVWSLDAKSLLRGGGGLFYTRTPSLLFSTAHTDTGIYPRFGSAIVTPGETASSRSATRSTTRTRPPA